MDRVITIQCQLPPEPLTLDENTMLSPLEEEALSKCSQAENMVNDRADCCFKTLKREVSEPQEEEIFCVCYTRPLFTSKFLLLSFTEPCHDIILFDWHSQLRKLLNKNKILKF